MARALWSASESLIGMTFEQAVDADTSGV